MRSIFINSWNGLNPVPVNIISLHGNAEAHGIITVCLETTPTVGATNPHQVIAGPTTAPYDDRAGRELPWAGIYRIGVWGSAIKEYIVLVLAPFGDIAGHIVEAVG